MRLTDILKPAYIVVPLKSDQKQEAIFELIDLVARQNGIANVQELRDAVWQRESARPTGIGFGIGVPHGRTASCAKLCMAIGVAKTPIEFNAIDGKPVSLVILLISPHDQQGPHIQALARISRMLKEEKYRAAIKDAQSPEEVYKLIGDFEADDQL